MGLLILTYGKEKEDNETFYPDSDLELSCAVILENLISSMAFQDREGARHELGILSMDGRIQKVWVQIEKAPEWVSRGSGSSWGDSDIMAFEIGKKKNNKPYGILFVLYGK